MTYPRGRTGHGPAPRAVRAASCVVLALAGAAAGCARPGNTPAGTPETSVTIVASAAPAVPAAPGRPSIRAGAVRAGSTCGRTPGLARPPGSARPTAEADPATPGPASSANPAEPAAERARRALEAQRSAIPQRGNVPPAAAARAADCITMLRMELSLRRAAHGRLEAEHLRAALTAAHLSRAVVRPDLRFAAATGDVCIVGTARSDPPETAIAPLGPGGTCAP